MANQVKQMDLSKRALLVSLNISMIHGTKRDRQATADVERLHHGTNLGRFNKDLVNKVYLDPIKKVAGSARSYLYANTLPWGDDDSRLLPISKYKDFVTQMNEFGTQYDATVTEFCNKWVEIMAEAQTRLGTLYNASEYPSAARLPQRFNFRVRYSPVPEASDFRVQLHDEEMEGLRKQLDESNKQVLAESMAGVWETLLDAVNRMADRLADPKAVFRDSLIGNLQDLCYTLPEFNFTNDEKLDKALSLIKSKLIVAPQRLRDDQTLRNDVVDKARKISEAMRGYVESMK